MKKLAIMVGVLVALENSLSNSCAQDGAPSGSAAIISGGTASANVSGGAVSQRSPGSMVTAGLARAQVGPSLAATDQASPRTVLIAAAIDLLFEQINDLIIFFDDLLRARAGLPPVVRPEPTPAEGDEGAVTGDGAEAAPDDEGTPADAGETDGAASEGDGGATPDAGEIVDPGSDAGDATPGAGDTRPPGEVRKSQPR